MSKKQTAAKPRKLSKVIARLPAKRRARIAAETAREAAQILTLRKVRRRAGKLAAYDPAEDLTSDRAIATFMAEAFATEDAGYIAHALGVVARAKGMSQIASQTGLSREQLYRSFSANGNPTLKTTIAVMKALGVELTAKVHG